MVPMTRYVKNFMVVVRPFIEFVSYMDYYNPFLKLKYIALAISSITFM